MSRWSEAWTTPPVTCQYCGEKIHFHYRRDWRTGRPAVEVVFDLISPDRSRPLRRHRCDPEDVEVWSLVRELLAA